MSGGADPRGSPETIPLIYNPASGGGKGYLRFRRAESQLALKGLRVDGIETKAPGHASELAADLATSHDMIFVLGGDGTLSEAANGILDSKHDPTLGFLPAGTGNDFLRDFEIEDISHAADRIALGTPRAIDAVRVEGDVKRWSINVFGTGFVSRAAKRCNDNYKWMGKNCYTAAVLRELVTLKNIETRLIIDGKDHSGRFPLVTACNSIHTGGAMKMAPQARPDDGLVDVMTLDACGRVELLRVFPKIFDGSHVRHKKVRFHRAKKVIIEPEMDSPLLADGEVFGSTPVTLTVKPGALKVLL